jgi:hypothetical protein
MKRNRLRKRSLQDRINQRIGRDKFVFNDSLQKSSAEILKQSIKEWKIPFSEKNILDGLLTGVV